MKMQTALIWTHQGYYFASYAQLALGLQEWGQLGG